MNNLNKYANALKTAIPKKPTRPRQVLINRPQHIRAPTFRSKRCFCTSTATSNKSYINFTMISNTDSSNMNHTCDNMNGHLGFVCPLFTQYYYGDLKPRSNLHHTYYSMIHYNHDFISKQNHYHSNIYCNTCLHIKLLQTKKG
jgi:hypothetical protein